MFLMETHLFFSTFSAWIFLSIFLKFYVASDIITRSQSITGDQTLVSQGQSFELGIFPIGSSNNLYLGMRYKNTPQVIVWIANRNSPLTDSYGVLTFLDNGTLALLNQNKSVIWSSNMPIVAENPVAQLLESGNFVVWDNTSVSSKRFLWQSFDYPSDTLLAGMKVGWDFKAGRERYLTTWKSDDDPSAGDFTYRIEHQGLPQLVINMGSGRKFRSGPWNGVRFSGLPVNPNPAFKPEFVFNEDELYYMFEPSSSAVMSKVTLTPDGSAQRLVLLERSTEWDDMYSIPNDPCDNYRRCGANGICKINNSPNCECLRGFAPKSPEQWGLLDWSSGCVRRAPLGCQKGDGFVKIERVKFPDLLRFHLNKSMSSEICKAECLRNCSCTAYANSNVSQGTGCLMWFGDLNDVRELPDEDNQQVIHIRLPAQELDSKKDERRVVIASVMCTLVGIFIAGFFFWFIIWKKRTRGHERRKEELELPLFDLATISVATNNFCQGNMIGAGGFGLVYKGTLSSGQEVAVKRLSKNSGQGPREFKNEVLLIAKLQHKNLVRLLGCCIQGDEKMLLYEYMPNKSLDYFIFDRIRSPLLEWGKRFDIIIGIARGLLYLHEDSRLQIIHRDLKASNILLDDNLNPKISDFGVARTFGGDEIDVKSKRIVGTYGYISPEFAYKGKSSIKSDVFSFGVLLLEIVSGKRNRGFSHPDHSHNLLGHAWLLWDQDKAFELMDACLVDPCVASQVLRSIQAALLCVQEDPEDRPAMSSVIFMLGYEGAKLPQPKHPGFFMEKDSISSDAVLRGEEFYSENAVTFTVPEGR